MGRHGDAQQADRRGRDEEAAVEVDGEERGPAGEQPDRMRGVQRDPRGQRPAQRADDAVDRGRGQGRVGPDA
jgi:hypothetical protein